MNKLRKSRVLNLTLISLFVALLALCSYISIPVAHASITLQTFGIYMCIFCLGAKRGLSAIGAYILGGIVGLPLFSGFMGGMGVILGASGGYILGFLPSALFCVLLLRFFPKNPRGYFISAILSLPLCYITGTLWYCTVYLGSFSAESFFSALTICVLPYLVPDILKLLAASNLGLRINGILNNTEKRY